MKERRREEGREGGRETEGKGKEGGREEGREKEKKKNIYHKGRFACLSSGIKYVQSQVLNLNDLDQDLSS
jgi:hypothetical protein